MFYKKANKTIEEDLACFDRERFRNKRLDESFTLTKKDKDVLRAFSDKKAASSKHLDTDGKVLNKAGLGGNDFARWKGNKIDIGDRPHVKGDEVIIRALKKIVPKNWLIHESFMMESSTWDDRKEIDLEIETFGDLIHDVNKNSERVSSLLLSIMLDMDKGHYKEEEFDLLKKNVISASEAIEVANVFILGAKEVLQGSKGQKLQRSQRDRKWLDKMVDKVS